MPTTPLSILTVDDVPAILKLVGAVLKKEGHQILEADNGDTALRVLENRKERIDLLITDVNMVPVRGPEVAAEARQLHPTIRTLYITGYTNMEAVIALEVEQGIAGFLPKPFTARDLLGAIDGLLSR